MNIMLGILIILGGLTLIILPALVSYKIRKRILLKGTLVKRFKALYTFSMIFFFGLAYKMLFWGESGKSGSIIQDSRQPDFSDTNDIIPIIATIIGLILLGIEIANRKFYKDTNNPDIYEEVEVEEELEE